MSEKTISFFQHEEEMTRLERSINRIWILCIVLIAALVGSNTAWIIHFLR